MTAITLNDIQSGYNVHKVNDNFTILEDNINNDVLHTAGGGNTMNQDIDMDGNSIFNLTTDPNNSQSAVSLQYLKEFTGVDEGIDERVDRLEALSTDRIVIDLLGALTYNLTVAEALHTSISFLNPHSSGSTLVTIPNAPEMPVRFYVHNDGPYDLEFVGVTGTPLVIKPGTTPLFKDLSTGEVYPSYVFSQPYAGSVVQDSLDSALYDSVTEVQAGIPTNSLVVVDDPLTDAIWKLQGQTLAILEGAGSPSTLYVAVDTYANIVANYSDAADGSRARFSDLQIDGVKTNGLWTRDRVEIYVDTFGAAGDGVTNDAAALIAAVAAAGIGGVIVLTPGKTYLTDRKITLLSGQTLLGYGATIKRRSQIISTTTSVITNGSTNSFTLASGGGALFSVGQEISLYNGANYGTQNLTIQGIVGDVITTTSSAALSAGSPWSGTTYVVLSFDVLQTTTGNNIFGVSFDGNKSNWSYYRWETVSEINVYGSTIIRDCAVNNAAGEGIHENTAGTACKYLNNNITNINGNGIHLSGSDGTLISGNYIYNTNLQGSAVGHNGGCITVSNSVSNYTICNNVLDTGRCGVGQVDSADNSYFAITGNTIRNMTSYMLEIRGYNAAVVDGLISGNRFYNTTAPAAGAMVSVCIGDTNTNDFYRLAVTGNQFHNSGVLIERSTGITVTGNSFGVDYQASDIYHNHISIVHCVDIVVSGNSTIFGNAGITLAGINSNLNIVGNSIEKPYYYGIYDVGGTVINIAENTISMDNNVNSSAQAIPTTGAGSTIKGNNIKMAAGHSGIRINGVANSVVRGNTVRCSGAGKSIRIETGSAGYVVAENQVNYAIVDTPSAGIRVANNDVIT